MCTRKPLRGLEASREPGVTCSCGCLVTFVLEHIYSIELSKSQASKENQDLAGRHCGYQEKSKEERMLGAMSGMDTALLGRKDFSQGLVKAVKMVVGEFQIGRNI